jgi:hypothetical protein
MKYRIAWVSLLTGFGGHGEYVLSEEDARRVAEDANREWSGVISHWIEAERS